MARRKGGLYLPLDVNFMDDPRIVRAGRDAGWLYLAMALACKRLGTDGRLEGLQIDRLHVKGWQKLLHTLLAEELVLDLNDGGYTISAWLQHNDPAHVIEARRQADSARKRGAVPNGLLSESERKRSREERSREPVRPESAPCPHGAHHAGLCALCRSLAGETG